MPDIDPAHGPLEVARLTGMSRAGLYKAWADGRGPEYFMLGKMRRVRESKRQEWMKRLEEETAAKLKEAADGRGAEMGVGA